MKKPFYTSHRNDQKSGGEAPTQAHMALLTGRIGIDPDAILPIPPGSHLYFISDPRRADGITEMILEKVVYENHVLKEVRLVAFTRSTQSTRRLSLKAVWGGDYKSGLEGSQGQAEKVIEDEEKNNG